jgi:hypothetical protein
MDPLSIAAGVAGLISAVYTIGKGTGAFKSSLSGSVAEYDEFEREIRRFSVLWQAVEPYLTSPQPYITVELNEELETIRRDTTKVLETVRDAITRIQKSDQWETGKSLHSLQQGNTSFLLKKDPIESIKRSRVDRLRLWFNKDEVRFQRTVLGHARASLDTVLAVIT